MLHGQKVQTRCYAFVVVMDTAGHCKIKKPVFSQRTKNYKRAIREISIVLGGEVDVGLIQRKL